MPRDGQGAADLRNRDVRRFTTLVALELRRAQRQLVALCILAAAIAGFMRATGAFTSENVFAWALAMGLSFVMIAGINALRDRLEGTLWLVAVLPVSPTMVAGARFAAAALIVLPGALIVGATLVGWSPVVPLSPLQIGAATLSAWVALAGASGVMIVMGTAVPPERLQWVPVAVLAAVIGVGRLLERIVPDPAAALAEALRRPGTLPLGLAVAVVLAGVAVYLAVVLTARAIARFDQPEIISRKQ